MAVNKVVFGGETVIDLTSDTVTPETLAQGVTAHDKAGKQIVGTMAGGSGGGSVETCTVQISYYEVDDSNVRSAIQVTYVNGENEVTTLTFDDWTVYEIDPLLLDLTISITVAKGTFVCTPYQSSVVSGEAEPLDDFGYAILINGDAELSSI